jgi:hypothetical protein
VSLGNAATPIQRNRLTWVDLARRPGRAARYGRRPISAQVVWAKRVSIHPKLLELMRAIDASHAAEVCAGLERINAWTFIPSNRAAQR